MRPKVPNAQKESDDRVISKEGLEPLRLGRPEEDSSIVNDDLFYFALVDSLQEARQGYFAL